jgi:hypothetical protein
MDCAHHLCTCQVAEGDTHCSSRCTESIGEFCACGHEACQGGPSTMREIDADALDPHTVAESLQAPGSTVQRDPSTGGAQR